MVLAFPKSMYKARLIMIIIIIISIALYDGGKCQGDSQRAIKACFYPIVLSFFIDKPMYLPFNIYHKFWYYYLYFI